MKEKSILIVDDSEEFREVAGEAIHQQGYRVIEADDGYGGLASMAAECRISELPMFHFLSL